MRSSISGGCDGQVRIALFSGNYNYVREGANQALNRLVGYLEAHAGHEVRVYSPVTKTPAFEPTGTLEFSRFIIRSNIRRIGSIFAIHPAACRR